MSQFAPASLGSYPSAGDSMRSSPDDLDSRRLAIVGMFRSQDHRSSGFGERIDGRAMAPLRFGEQSREFRLDPERLERGLPALCGAVKSGAIDSCRCNGVRRTLTPSQQIGRRRHGHRRADQGAEDHLRDAGECLAPNFLGLTSVLPWSERCASRTQVLTPNLFLLEHRYRPAIASHLAIFLAPPPAVERRRRSRFHRWFRRKPITPDHRKAREGL